MALLQCMDFLKKYPHMLVEDKDTLKQPKNPRKQLKGIAAIASKTASLMYDLKLLPEIDDKTT
jgi:prephenate dehydratase